MQRSARPLSPATSAAILNDVSEGVTVIHFCLAFQTFFCTDCFVCAIAPTYFSHGRPRSAPLAPGTKDEEAELAKAEESLAEAEEAKAEAEKEVDIEKATAEEAEGKIAKLEEKSRDLRAEHGKRSGASC